jgi:hypothetical protein
LSFQNIFIHPNYKNSAKYFDIALIELKDPVPRSQLIWPACLETGLKDKFGIDLLIAGFGRNSAMSKGPHVKTRTSRRKGEYGGGGATSD